MRDFRQTYLLIVLVLGLPMVLIAQEGGQYFYGEDRFKKPVRISSSIERAIRNNQQFSDCLPTPVEFKGERFEAMTVDLNRDGSLEVLVKGRCGNSSTSYFYWILANLGGRYNSVLFDAALGFELREAKSNGWSNIRFSGCTATTCFHREFAFDGRKYFLKREWQKAKN